MTERPVRVRAIAVGVLVTTCALLVLVFPINSRLDTVKPCGTELACSVPRHKSLALSLIDAQAPFDGLNRISVPLLVAGALVLGVGAGAATEQLHRRTTKRARP